VRNARGSTMSFGFMKEPAPHWQEFCSLDEGAVLESPAARYAVQRVFLRALDEVELPPAAISALSVAQRFADGVADEKELTEARVALWRAIDGRENDLSDSSVCAVRSALCAMYAPSADNDSQEQLAFFLDMWDRAGFPPEPAADAIRKIDVTR
jgi:hypothetical protein